jgi:hypothetical protein
LQAQRKIIHVENGSHAVLFQENKFSLDDIFVSRVIISKMAERGGHAPHTVCMVRFS